MNGIAGRISDLQLYNHLLEDRTMTITNPFAEVNPARRRSSSVRSARTIDDLRDQAKRQLPNFLYEYLEGGAEDEWTLRNNRNAFYQYRFLPRMLQDVSKRSLEQSIFGKKSSLPLIIAPTGFAGFFWPDGDIRLAEAAAAAGIPMTQSTVSMSSIKDVAATPSLRHWFQLYWWGGQEVRETLIDRAICSGSEVLVLTTDGPVGGNREWDQRNYRAPNKLSLRSMANVLAHPGWALRMAQRGRIPNFENLIEFGGDDNANIFKVSEWIAKNQLASLSWADVRWVRDRWPGKLVLKGVLRSEEAVRAVDMGVDGIVISNHGGRQAEPAVSSLEMLPEIRAAVGKELTLILDSGIRRGSDIAMAIALGADAVMTGRATLYGLSAGGLRGVSRAIEILGSELDRTLALNGLSSLLELQPSSLRPFEPITSVRTHSKPRQDE